MNEVQERALKARIQDELVKYFTWSKDAIESLVVEMVKFREEEIWKEFTELIRIHQQSVDERRKTDPYAEGIYQILGKLWYGLHKILGWPIQCVWPRDVQQTKDGN